MPGIRRASASRFAARIIIFDGTQPQYGHSPPTSLASTLVTLLDDIGAAPVTVRMKPLLR